MAATNLEIITYAYQKLGVVDENSSPSNEQGVVGLNILNDYLLNEAADGMRLGWWLQTSLSATAPLRDSDIYGVKLLLSIALASHYGIALEKDKPLLVMDAAEAKRQLVKRSLLYSEADFSEFPRPQGGPLGGPNWI